MQVLPLIVHHGVPSRSPGRPHAPCEHTRRTARHAFAATGQACQLATGPAGFLDTQHLSWTLTPQESSTDHRRPSSESQLLRGSPEPLGASLSSVKGAVNFAICSLGATAVTLCLFTPEDLHAGRVSGEIELDPAVHRTGSIWHVLVTQMEAGLLYGFRLDGLHQEACMVPAPSTDNEETQTDGEASMPDRTAAKSKTVSLAPGQRFDQDTIVLDPFAHGVVSRPQFGQLGQDLDYRDGALGIARTWPQGACVLPSSAAPFDWQGDRPLHLPMQDCVIYEAHMRGFTMHPSSKSKNPGTYRGMIEKLDHLQSLGINCLELLPVQEFNEMEYYQEGRKPERYNFWGYSTAAFFAPMARYSSAVAQGGPGQAAAHELKLLVRECHARGMEVLMDVVFNHTAEGNQQGPSISLRGMDNRMFYMLAPGGEYYNYSGCGNTVNCNHPLVRRFLLDCLRFWVSEYHVDGFRFDLASIMTRAPSLWSPSQTSAPEAGGNTGWLADGAGCPAGTPLAMPPLVELISEDPLLRDTKLIAEAWDCDGLNQVGGFPHFGGRWAEWNGYFRDTVRQFVKGTEGPWAAKFAAALCGSPDVYASPASEGDWWGTGTGEQWRGGRGPTHSINFIAAHDGFTLADLVSHNQKHNRANGESNRDGEEHNLSWNCGVEGATTKAPVLNLRARQMRNLASALLLAHGVPMMQMGDEYGHSKGGNNNTYCHDSPLNYLDWGACAEDASGFARFVRHMVHLRHRRVELRRASYGQGGSIAFHGPDGGAPDWSDDSRFVGLTLGAPEGGLYIAFNSGHKPLVAQLPDWPGRTWVPLVDTGKVAPLDFLQADEALSPQILEAALAAGTMWTQALQYPMLAYSAVVLVSKDGNQATPAHRRVEAFAAKS